MTAKRVVLQDWSCTSSSRMFRPNNSAASGQPRDAAPMAAFSLARMLAFVVEDVSTSSAIRVTPVDPVPRLAENLGVEVQDADVFARNGGHQAVADVQIDLGADFQTGGDKEVHDGGHGAFLGVLDVIMPYWAFPRSTRCCLSRVCVTF